MLTRRRRDGSARFLAALAALEAQIVRPGHCLDVEEVDRLLGRVYEVRIPNADPVRGRVSSFDDRGACSLQVLNGHPRRQVLPAISVAAAIDAGVFVEV